MDWDLISFVTGNRIRFKTLISLKSKARTPTVISKDTGFPITHTSTALKKMEDKGLVECLSPSARKNKFYRITEKGKKILESICENTELKS